MNTFVLSFQELTVRTGNCQSYANLAGASSSGDQYYHIQLSPRRAKEQTLSKVALPI